MKRFAMSFAAVVMLVGLAACGGGDSSPTTPTATVAPTPAPVTYNGTYTGASMSFTSPSGQIYVSASTTIVHTGQALELGSLRVMAPISTSYGLGSAILNGNTFQGVNQYSSSGCGIVTSNYRGYFSGDGGIMNITVTLSTSRCGDVDIRGEMRR